jgi:hypothetical protein
MTSIGRWRNRATVAVVCLLAAAPGCVRQPMRGVPATGLDRKLSTFAFIEEGDLVTVIVDVLATRDRGEHAYVPLEVAIANQGLKHLRLTRESFSLVDDAGQRYPLSTARELIEGYDLLDHDRRVAELVRILPSRFATFTRYPSRFSPQPMGPDDRPTLVLDSVTLPQYGYLLDVLYFPMPAGGVNRKTLELFVESADLPDPVFVRFSVP